MTSSESGHGGGMDAGHDYHTAAAMLVWQYDLGATEAMLDAPLNRYELPEAAQTRPKAEPAPVAMPAAADPVAVARAMAAAADSLAGLQAALAGFDLCDLKRGAKSTVFADGSPAARVMVIGEAPSREEDIEGKPFAGRAGQLLDRMFAAIGLLRGHDNSGTGLYVLNALPWRPMRDPDAAQMAMLQPFLERHVQLAAPDVIVVMGNTPLQMVAGRSGISRCRGQWTTGFDRPVLPMLHPDQLLRNPSAKREAWADLLALKAWLRGQA